MSIQSVTTNPYAYAYQTAGSSSPTQALQALGSALSSGNLSAAQADFSQLLSSSGNAGTNIILNGDSGGGDQLTVDPLRSGIQGSGTWNSNDPGPSPFSATGTWNSSDPGPAGSGTASTNTILSGNAPSTANPVQTDLNALGSALQAGNTTAAQTAFTQLQQDMQKAGGHHHHHHASFSQAPTESSTSATSAAATTGATSTSTSASQVSPAVSAIAALAQAGSPSTSGSVVTSLLSMFA